MLKVELEKILFALEMARNRLKEDKDVIDCIMQARDIVFNELCEGHNHDGRG